VQQINVVAPRRGVVSSLETSILNVFSPCSLNEMKDFWSNGDGTAMAAAMTNATTVAKLSTYS
jgi:hypothetical protein